MRKQREEFLEALVRLHADVRRRNRRSRSPAFLGAEGMEVLMDEARWRSIESWEERRLPR